MSKTPDDEDKQLFRQAMAGVRRLKVEHSPLEHQRPKPIKRPLTADDQHQTIDTLSDDYEPHYDSDQEDESFARTGLQKKLLRKLRL